MANNLVIPKNYADAAVLFEADLDEIKTALETFINTTLLTGDNIQSGALLGASINDNLLDDTTLEFTSERKITIKDNSLDATKFAVGSLSLPIGSIDDFYIAGSTLTIPRGWMFLNGDVVNETDYEAIHGVGTYTTDGVASSAVDGETLPNTGARLITGTASTTGATSGATDVTYQHHHKILNYDSTNTNSYDSAGNENEIARVSVANANVNIFMSPNSGSESVDFDMYTDDLISASFSTGGLSKWLCKIIRVI